MSLRLRLVILVAVSVAAAVVLVSFAAYFVTRDRLYSELDESLVARARGIASRPEFEGRGPGPDGGPGSEGEHFGPTTETFQVIDAQGNIVGGDNEGPLLPVDGSDIAVANGERGEFFRDVSIDGEPYRLLTVPTNSAGEAAQVARSLSEVQNALEDLRLILIAIGGAGVIAATAVGLFVAHRSLAPVARLTTAAEHVAASQDLSHPIDIQQSDEIGRLAASINTMLRALDDSKRQQQQLVMDASHELRTPLTSLRTNIEVLARANDMPEDEKRELLRDVTTELGELTKLVAELVELATDPLAERGDETDVRLDAVVAQVAERAHRRTGLRIDVHSEPTMVIASPALIERAVSNLIDNACKWSPSDATIDVTLRDGRLEVRDHGPGIPTEDLPYVFNRFYRSATARAKPGSGLGLAIVKKVIEASGGRAFVTAAPDGGTVAGFEIPPAPADAMA